MLDKDQSQRPPLRIVEEGVDPVSYAACSLHLDVRLRASYRPGYGLNLTITLVLNKLGRCSRILSQTRLTSTDPSQPPGDRGVRFFSR